MDNGTWLSIAGLLLVALGQSMRIRCLSRHLDAHERRLRVVEGLLGARGLLPDEPREAEAGTERLRLARYGDEQR